MFTWLYVHLLDIGVALNRIQGSGWYDPQVFREWPPLYLLGSDALYVWINIIISFIY